MKKETVNTDPVMDQEERTNERIFPTMSADKAEDDDDEEEDTDDEDMEEDTEDADDADKDEDYTILPSNDSGITADDNAATGKMHEKEGE